MIKEKTVGIKHDQGKREALYNYYEGLSIVFSSATASELRYTNFIRYFELGSVCIRIATADDCDDKILMLSDLFADIVSCPVINCKDMPLSDLIKGISQVCKHGAEKYTLLNYLGLEPKRCLSALMRHVEATILDYKVIDDDSGLPHICHILSNILILTEIYQLQDDAGSSI